MAATRWLPTCRTINRARHFSWRRTRILSGKRLPAVIVIHGSKRVFPRAVPRLPGLALAPHAVCTASFRPVFLVMSALFIGAIAGHEWCEALLLNQQESLQKLRFLPQPERKNSPDP